MKVTPPVGETEFFDSNLGSQLSYLRDRRKALDPVSRSYPQPFNLYSFVSLREASEPHPNRHPQQRSMATGIASPITSKKPFRGLPGRRYDHLFFSAMALLILATVLAGFARTYYLAGVFRAPLPSLIIHLHAAAFSCWILLLITQTSLVSAGRVDIHRRLGIAGFFLGSLMVILGVMAATDSLVRRGGPVGRDVQAFYIVPMTDMVFFATVLFLAFRNRRDGAAHKRFILVATNALMIAAVARVPIAFSFRNIFIATLLSDIFLLALVAYDLWSTHKIHRATLWAGGFLIFIQQIRLPIGKTAAWHLFASWVQRLQG